MKKLDTDQPVLVTGGTGYLATWIIKYLLEQGTPVHATVRNLKDKKKYTHLLNLAEEANASLKLFEADLLHEGSFAQAMKGCTVVFHTASPFFVTRIKNPVLDLIKPAVQGTTNVLNQASQTPEVKRIVLTSSVAAIMGDGRDALELPDQTFDETYWNTSSHEKHQPYSYSKTLAERKAWEIAGQQQQWDLVVINPSFILGPSLNNNPDATSSSIIKQLADGTLKMGAPDFWYGIVDVRDVARAHLLAAWRPGASGRHILASDHGNFLDIANIIRKKYPQYPLPKKLISRNLLWLMGPLFGISRKMIMRNYGYHYRLNNSYSREDLDLHYRPMEETILDHFDQMVSDKVIK